MKSVRSNTNWVSFSRIARLINSEDILKWKVLQNSKAEPSEPESPNIADSAGDFWMWQFVRKYKEFNIKSSHKHMQMFERLIVFYDGKLFNLFHMPSRIIYLIPFYPLSLRFVRHICLGTVTSEKRRSHVDGGGTRLLHPVMHHSCRVTDSTLARDNVGWMNGILGYHLNPPNRISSQLYRETKSWNNNQG